MKSTVIRFLATVIAVVSLMGGMAGCGTSTRLRVATTTSLYDTGLWDYLEPMFEEQYNTELDIMYAGTGKALEYGRRGDVDVLIVHAKARELQFIAKGYGARRVPFAYNYFLIVGPEDDPAGIKGMSPEASFIKLMETESGSFVSRGDDSGTHSKEKAMWQAAGFNYEAVRAAGNWYIESGAGMGPTLLLASEKRSYTLSDLGTFLAYRDKLNLVSMVDKGDILLNVYSAIVVNYPETKIDIANNLISFLTSPEIQKLIGTYGAREYGRQLFIPWAGAEIK